MSQGDPTTVEPFGAKLRRLREQAGLTLERLAHMTAEADPNGKGLTFSYLGKIERGLERPSVARMETLAELLGLDPGEFIEYRLARAREQLDERAVGLEQAARNLRMISDALRETGREHPAKAY